MLPIPLFGIGNQGRSVNVDAQERTNLYVELNNADPQKNIVTLYTTPGLVSFVDFGATPIRGLYQVGDYMYAVHGDKFYKVLNDATFSVIGTLLTNTGNVDIADNGNQIMIVDGTNGYIYNLTTLVFEQITDVDFVASDTVTYFNSRFVVQEAGNTGRFAISAQYDGLAWDALDFATAEASPDRLVRVYADSGLLQLFGDKTNEPWGDNGAVDFPFSRIGSGAIEWGLAARWSLCKFIDSLIFLRTNRLGQVQVCVQAGGAAQAISTPEMDVEFGTYSVTSDATAFTYMHSGHAFYQINFPSANKSWLFDGQSKSWSKLQSGTGRHRGDKYTQYLGRNFVSDYENGKIYRLDINEYTDDGAMIIREFISRHVGQGDWSTLSMLWLEFEEGVGLETGQGSDPQVIMRVSKDGGKTYGLEQWRSIGKIGKFNTRAVWNRLGRAREWTFKFRVTDPIKVVITQAWGTK